MFIDQLLNLTNLVGRNTAITRQRDWFEPELTFPIRTSHMNRRRLSAFVRVEVKPKVPNPETVGIDTRPVVDGLWPLYRLIQSSTHRSSADSTANPLTPAPAFILGGEYACQPV